MIEIDLFQFHAELMYSRINQKISIPLKSQKQKQITSVNE